MSLPLRKTPNSLLVILHRPLPNSLRLTGQLRETHGMYACINVIDAAFPEG
jgi:hypothetical protein